MNTVKYMIQPRILWALLVVVGVWAEDIGIDEYKEIAVREFVNGKNTINPSTTYTLTEYNYGHGKEFPVRLFLLRAMSQNGQQFNEMQFFTIGTREIFKLSSAFGGYGVMSAVNQNGVLYLTNSWGSGIHRTEIYAITKGKEGNLMLFGYPQVQTNGDAVVVCENGAVVLKECRYFGFNNFEHGNIIGVVTFDGSSVLIDGSPNKAIQPSR